MLDSLTVFIALVLPSCTLFFVKEGLICSSFCSIFDTYVAATKRSRMRGEKGPCIPINSYMSNFLSLYLVTDSLSHRQPSFMCCVVVCVRHNVINNLGVQKSLCSYVSLMNNGVSVFLAT